MHRLALNRRIALDVPLEHFSPIHKSVVPEPARQLSKAVLENAGARITGIPGELPPSKG